MQKRFTLWTTAVVVAVALLAISAMPAWAQEPPSIDKLEGDWIVTVVQPNGDRFVNLITFTANGEILIFASYKFQTSLGKGSYRRTGDRTFTLAMAQLNYDDKGVQNQLAIIRSTIVMNDALDEFSGPNMVEIINPANGRVNFSGNGGLVTATRIKSDDGQYAAGR